MAVAFRVSVQSGEHPADGELVPHSRCRRQQQLAADEFPAQAVVGKRLQILLA